MRIGVLEAATCGNGGTKAVLKNLNVFLLRTNPKNRQPPTANCHQPPTDTRQMPPTTDYQPPSATNHHQPPTANRQPLFNVVFVVLTIKQSFLLGV